MTEEQLARMREEMDALNRELLDVFLRRMMLSCEIMRRKEAQGLPAFDPAREDAIVRQMAELAGAEAGSHAERLFRTVLELCHDRFREQSDRRD